MADDKNLVAFQELIKSLPTDEARFIVFDFADTKADGRQIKKLLLIKWCEGVQAARGQGEGGGRASGRRGRVRRGPSAPRRAARRRASWTREMRTGRDPPPLGASGPVATARVSRAALAAPAAAAADRRAWWPPVATAPRYRRHPPPPGAPTR